ncbi:MAG: M48 family peptidase [Spartobacteria bacterium]|nr:M48 family peptidase [Spartobacteria bacterium]
MTRDKDAFKAEVRAWAVRLNVEPSQIRIQKMRNKWASCSPTKWISFSEDILKESEGFQRYVIVHELLHLRIPNHGKLFRCYMSAYVPDWEKWKNRDRATHEALGTRSARRHS